MAGKYWYSASRPSASSLSTSSSAFPGPDTIDNATARLRATTGDGHTDNRAS